MYFESGGDGGGAVVRQIVARHVPGISFCMTCIGNQKDMEELIDALQGEECSADEGDHETDEEIKKGL